MAKWFGKIGFAEGVEEEPGIWVENLVIREYYGEVGRNNRRLQSADQVNDDLNVNNEISIVADPYANEHFYSMRYIEFMGSKWKISNVEVKFPRLILTIGGVYNG